MSNKCDTTAHKGHMCVLVSEKRFDEIMRLVANPRFVCFNCGRVAHDRQNLCNPMELGSQPSGK